MKTCSTCRHWDDKYMPTIGHDRRVCDRIRHRGESGNNDQAILQDFEDYKASLLTKADFGCILHEEQKNEV